MKTCSKCKEEKELVDFSKDKTKKDGYDYNCKICKYSKIKKVYENPEQLYKHRLSVKKWMNNPENRNKKLQHHKTYRSKIIKNPTKKLSRNLSTYLWMCLKGKKLNTLSKQTLKTIGLSSWDEFRKHIESTWLDEMNWNNWGKGKNNSTWHIDHIKPVNKCNTEDEVKECFYYTNLRAFWGSDNIRKKDSI